MRRPNEMTKGDIQLPRQFLNKFPDLSYKKAVKLHTKYLNIVRKYLFRSLPYIQGDITNFPMKEAFDLSGEFQYKNQRYYVWKEFYPLQPFFFLHKLGNNLSNMLSEVRIKDQKLIDLLIDTADINELVKTFYSKYDNSERFNVTIDYDSLVAYISRTQHLLSTIDTSTNYYNKLLANYRTAKFFKIISEHFYNTYNEYVIPHVISDKKDYGRTYYKGINLQNCSKEVREAAFGDHISYDLNAAAYAVKLILAKDIIEEYDQNFNGLFTYTKEYLDHKSEIRNELANVLHQHMPNYPNPMKLVKEAMNAIGFGAKMHEGSWEYEGLKHYSALHYIIYNKNARIAFSNHNFIVNFLKEQDLMTKIIYEYYSRNENFVDRVKNIPNIYAKNGKLSKSKVLAYLYQQMETLIMDSITENITPKLRIHDGFIMTKPLSNDALLDIKYKLKQISPYLTLSTETYSGWISQNVLDIENEHKQFIEEEELIANNGVMPIKFVKQNNKTFVQTDYNCYDGYDDGKRYDQYDSNNDESVQDMTPTERQEHYRIVGYNINNLPEKINKLIRNK
jgi:hypothetical protein